MYSNCILDHAANLLIRRIIFGRKCSAVRMWDLIVSIPDHCLSFTLIASHLKCLDLSFEFCYKGPALTGIKEDR